MPSALRHNGWHELEGVTMARWKTQFTFNFVFTDLSTFPLTKRGVTSCSEKMLFSAHSYVKKIKEPNMFNVSIWQSILIMVAFILPLTPVLIVHWMLNSTCNSLCRILQRTGWWRWGKILCFSYTTEQNNPIKCTQIHIIAFQTIISFPYFP